MELSQRSPRPLLDDHMWCNLTFNLSVSEVSLMQTTLLPSSSSLTFRMNTKGRCRRVLHKSRSNQTVFWCCIPCPCPAHPILALLLPTFIRSKIASLCRSKRGMLDGSILFQCFIAALCASRRSSDPHAILTCCLQSSANAQAGLHLHHVTEISSSTVFEKSAAAHPAIWTALARGSRLLILTFLDLDAYSRVTLYHQVK